jgi:hypothetical protein
MTANITIFSIIDTHPNKDTDANKDAVPCVVMLIVVMLNVVAP